MSAGWRSPSMAADLLKALRSEPRTGAELREYLGWGRLTLTRWLGELCANGILDREPDPRAVGKTGRAPFIYWLRKEWGGQC